MKKLISLLFILSISFAQQMWKRTWGGAGNDEGYSVQQTSDGGYIVVGTTGSFGAVNLNVYLIKTDSTGNTLWTKIYGDSSWERAYSVQQTQDNGYIIAGWKRLIGSNSDFYLIKTNITGDTLWTRTYGNQCEEYGESVQQTSDGGYIIAGSRDDPSNSIYLIKTNIYGDTIWTRTFNWTYASEGFSVQQTTDGSFVVVGCFRYNYNPPNDILLINISPIGDCWWAKGWGGGGNDVGRSIMLTLDGGFIITGITNSVGAGGYDVYLVKTDSLGDTLWSRTYGGTGDDEGMSVKQTLDGGYIIVGWTNSFGAGDYDIYLIRTDSLGDTLWTRTYGGVFNDGGYSVQQTTDGGYIIAGYTNSFGAGGFDVYLIKTDANGYVTVEENKNSIDKLKTRINAIPNPFTSFTRIPVYEKEDFVLADITGRVVGKYKGEKIGGNLSTGVYFVIPQNKNQKPIRIVKIR